MNPSLPIDQQNIDNLPPEIDPETGDEEGEYGE